MRVVPTVNYETMLILGQSAAADLAGSVAHVKEIFTKHGATIIALKKWGDRQFAYPIRKQKRGMYILCYFSAPTDRLADCSARVEIKARPPTATNTGMPAIGLINHSCGLKNTRTT